MEDEKYVFIEDVKTRKDVARSARKKKNGAKSRKVTFPSDYLTKKEREKMNGECKTWSMFKFYNWEEFQEMPADIQVQYLNSIIYRYGVGICTISKHQFKKSPSNLDKYLTAHGIKSAIKHTSPGTGPAVKKNLSRYLEAIEKQNQNETANSPEIVIDFKVEEPPEKPADIFIPDGMAPGYCSDGTKVEDAIKELNEKLEGIKKRAKEKLDKNGVLPESELMDEVYDALGIDVQARKDTGRGWVADISKDPVESALDFSTNPDGEFVEPVPVTFGAPVEEPCADISKLKPGVSSMLINMDGFDLELIDYLSMQKFKDKKVKITMTINVVED